MNNIGGFENDQLLNQLVDGAEQGIVVYGLALTYRLWNPYMEKLTGVMAGDILGKHPTDIFDFLEGTDLMDRLASIATLGQTSAVEYPFNKPGCDDSGWAADTASPLRDSDGKISGIVSIVNDITQRKEMQDALRDSEEKYRSMYTNAPLSYQSLDVEGNFLDVNPMWLRTLGWSRDEVIGKPYADFLHSNWQPHFEQNFANFKKMGFINGVEFKIRHKNGHYLDISFNGCIGTTPEGEFKQTYCVFEEITARKKEEAIRLELEAQVRQKFKMEAVGVMAGGIAHNFNNNLAIILGNVELARTKVPAGNEGLELLENAEAAIQRSRELVTQILAYSRDEVRDKIPIHVPLLLEETFKLLRAAIPSSVDLQLHVSDKCGDATFNADSSSIQETLINLCNNAVQAMNEKGTLILKLDRVALTAPDIPAQFEGPAGTYIRLSVSDDGCGMPEATKEKIFDPFYTTKAVGEGTGLGLSTVLGIVNQHDGLIKVQSTLGQGSTFDLYFPILEASVLKPVDSGRSPAGPLGTERVLFVDDEEMLVRIGERVLVGAGYRVTTATDGEEALELVREDPQRYDLVVTDQTMPGLTGMELSAKVREIQPKLPVILVSGYSSEITSAEAREIGIWSCCQKPMDMLALLTAVRTVLDEAAEPRN